MREKKVRGLKRKTKKMIKQIELETINFPSDFHNGYWHLHLPVARSFISSSRTPFGIKRFCIQTLLDRAEHLIRIKPNIPEKYRVAIAFDLPGLWGSQIIVFKGDSHFNGFFDRNNENQKWIPLSQKRNIKNEWGLSVPTSMQIFGFKEEIMDEDGNRYDGEIWFIGELI